MAQLIGRWWRDAAGRNKSGVVDFDGKVALGAGGAISGSYVANTDTPGFIVSKVSAKVGRYLIQMRDSAGNAVVYPGGLSSGIWVAIQTASADTAYTAGKAAGYVMRANTITTDGGVIFQLIGANNADTEAEDSAILWVSFAVRRSLAQT